MHIRLIGQNNTVIVYRQITNLNFTIEADFVSESMPINQFSVDIQTMDDIEVSQFAYLYDDLNVRWAKYWIIDSIRISEDVVRIVAQSLLVKMERVVVPAVMYNDTMGNIITDLMQQAGVTSYTLDSTFDDVPISGYCPEQTAKERLQWICFVTGAYVKTFFTSTIDIVPLDATTTKIPMNKTFWMPSISHRDIVTGIFVVAFSYEEVQEPASVGEYVKAGNKYYQVSRTLHVTQNSDAIDVRHLPTTEIHIGDIGIVNSVNADSVGTKLARVYFERTELTFDCVNNGTYMPGDRVAVYMNREDIAIGVIRSCSFSFGKQARSTVEMTVLEMIKTNVLYVIYWLSDTSIKLGGMKYHLSVGEQYSIENPYLDQTTGAYRNVYYPLTEAVSGTMIDRTKTENVYYKKALVAYEPDGILAILSVDGVDYADGSNEVIVIE